MVKRFQISVSGDLELTEQELLEAYGSGDDPDFELTKSYLDKVIEGIGAQQFIRDWGCSFDITIHEI